VGSNLMTLPLLSTWHSSQVWLVNKVTGIEPAKIVHFTVIICWMAGNCQRLFNKFLATGPKGSRFLGTLEGFVNPGEVANRIGIVGR